MRNPRKRSGPRETVIVGDVLDALNTLSGVYAWRNNTGAAKIRGRTVRYGDVGSADILACIRGRFVAFECKTATGRQSEDQRVWGEQIQAVGGRYYVVRSATEVVTIARALGATPGRGTGRVFPGATPAPIGPDGWPRRDEGTNPNDGCKCEKCT